MGQQRVASGLPEQGLKYWRLNGQVEIVSPAEGQVAPVVDQPEGTC